MRDSFEQAVMELRKAAVIDPVNKWKYFLQIGDLFANEGQIEEAMAFWSRVSERVFTDATILYQLGCRHFRAERTAQAIELLQRAIQANPNIHFYHMTLGNMYDYLGDHPKAVAEYRKALELSTQSMLLPVRQRLSVVQQTWAYDLFDKREHEAALRQFKEIRAFQEVLEKYYRAEKDQRGLERLSPESADVQVQIARCCEALGRAEQAKPLYDRVTQELPTALIRISPIRKMSLRYLLQLKTQMGALKPDNMNVAGSAEAKPFKLRLVQHTRLHDIARQHSVTPNGVLYSGLSSWVEVDPLSGKVLRQAPAGKVTVYESGIEVQVTREDKSDVIRIVRDGKSVTVPSLGEFRVRVPSLQISAERVFLTGKVGGATRIIALDAGTGAIAWNVEAPGHTQDTVFGEKYVASIESNADRSTAVVRDATTAKTLLTKELPGEGIWIAPAIWADKLFLAEDTTWTLYMMDIATGEFDYSLAFQDIFPRPPLVHEGILYLHVRGYRDRTIYLYAIQPETGQILWKTDMKAMSVHSPPIFRGPDLVYLNPETNTVFMIDRATGVRHAEASYEDQTTQQQRDYIHSLRAFGPHLLIVGGRGDIHAFELLTQ
jgi:tetratricopeptide (TPR) repeat protein/outer membrane protein assembly factor BamB